MPVKLPPVEELDSLTSDQAAEVAAAYLAIVGPGKQPLPLFKEFCRLVVLNTVEVAPLLVRPGEAPQVLLTQRPESDPWFPGQWHIPGVALLPTDVGEEYGRYSYAKPFERLYGGELAGSIIPGENRLFDAGLRKGPRGVEQTVHRWAEITLHPHCDGRPPVGEFFDATMVADNPPDGGLIVTHDVSIRRAVAHHAAFITLPPELQEAFV